MRTAIITGSDHYMHDLGVLTGNLINKYSKIHGFDFLIACFQDISFFPSKIHPAWKKLEVVSDSLNYHDRVIWMDADVIITNPNIPPPETTSGFHASRDWGADGGELDFNSGVFIAHKDVLPMFEEAQKLTQWQNKPLWDQSALREVAPQFQDKITIYPRRTFNPVPIDIHETVVDPWQPGDWLCHLTMVPLKKKIELFHKYASK